MLVAKINPPAKRIIQDSPFTFQEFLGEYMIAKCTKLPIGASTGSENDSVEFTIKFGNIKYEPNLDGTPGTPLFDKVFGTAARISASELSNWGTDDSVVYTVIAQKFNFQVIETFELDIPFNN